MLSNKKDIEECEKRVENTKNYIIETIEIIKDQLLEDMFIQQIDETYKLTPLGYSATHIQEGHSLILAELLMRIL